MSATLDIQLHNRTKSDQVYAFVTGLALDHGNQPCFIKSDGKTPYYPTSPSHTVATVSENVSIKLGGPNSITTITIPHLAGGRIWFSIGKELAFFLNPGPAIVEPSVTNPSDANLKTIWSFCEFTFSSNSIYANISYVDFVSLPISLTLTPTDGPPQKVLGLKSDGLDTVCAGLQSQHLADAADWKKLIVSSGGHNIRVLSPNNAIVANGGNLFKGYFEPYVNQVWEQYSKNQLHVDTHAQWGKLKAHVSKDHLTFPGGVKFSKPSTADIFGCSSGPFANNKGAAGPLTARISAALNRSTLHLPGVHPNEEKVEDFYKHPITNHYSRLVHQANIDGRGYAFPYDDVPGKGVDQSGFVNGSPKAFLVSIG